MGELTAASLGELRAKRNVALNLITILQDQLAEIEAAIAELEAEAAGENGNTSDDPPPVVVRMKPARVKVKAGAAGG
jgi:hypothetical protein